jgi:hypothetical protein
MNGLTKQEEEIISAMEPGKPTTVEDLQDALGVTYWGIYPYMGKLEGKGLIISDGFRRDRKKVWRKADLSKTPRLHVRGVDSLPVELFNIAQGAPISKKNGSETGQLVNGFPYTVLRLYQLASSIEAGHQYDKAYYQQIRKEAVTLKNRLENMALAVQEFLNHPVMSGDAKTMVDTLMSDPESPLDREKILDLMRECEA